MDQRHKLGVSAIRTAVHGRQFRGPLLPEKQYDLQSVIPGVDWSR